MTDRPLPRRWLSVSEAAAYFGIRSPKTLYTLIGRHQLPAAAVLRIGKQIRVDVSAIEAGAGKDRRQ